MTLVTLSDTDVVITLHLTHGTHVGGTLMKNLTSSHCCIFLQHRRQEIHCDPTGPAEEEVRILHFRVSRIKISPRGNVSRRWGDGEA